jgi:alpha-tubulin suppressor-like RCC1 family protein
MPTFYNYTENGVVYSFDDVFVPVDAFRKGTLLNWGRNNNGNLGTNNSTQSSIPVETSAGATTWEQVSSGYRHTAAIKTDGTLWNWGWNLYGQLGIGTSLNTSIVPVQTSSAGTTWKQVACGYGHSAAVKTDGTLWTWGRNNHGQLGTNNTTQRLTPGTTSTAGTNWKQVACGDSHTAAVKTNGTLWTWGLNQSGQIGNGSSGTDILLPTTLAGTTWKQVSCGNRHTAAIKTDGTLWTWGSNSYGLLGDGTTTGQFSPIQVGTATTWKQVACGTQHNTAIKTDGTLWTWGYNNRGQLGNGVSNTTANPNPAETSAGGTNWKQVSANGSQGYGSTGAIKTDGTLWLWGSNYQGKLGDGTTTNRFTPTQISGGGTNWKQVSCGGEQSAAIKYIDDYL